MAGTGLEIRLEKRCGKKLTVISGLHTYGAYRLDEIARVLKLLCAAGGTVKNGKIEIQGDNVERIREWFRGQEKKDEKIPVRKGFPIGDKFGG